MQIFPLGSLGELGLKDGSEWLLQVLNSELLGMRVRRPLKLFRPEHWVQPVVWGARDVWLG
jgi:hypothetical protein